MIDHLKLRLQKVERNCGLTRLVDKLYWKERKKGVKNMSELETVCCGKEQCACVRCDCGSNCNC
jgi:hypothetical protein